MILLVPLYVSPHPSRTAEILGCLEKNVASGVFERIIVVTERPEELPASVVGSVEQICLNERQKYTHLIAKANEFPGKVCVIANDDIVFDETLLITEQIDFEKTLWAISRRDTRGQLEVRTSISQDAWAFIPPAPELQCDFYFGVPCCDNRIAWEFNNAGWKVANPHKFVSIRHFHDSGVRAKKRGKNTPRGGALYLESDRCINKPDTK